MLTALSKKKQSFIWSDVCCAIFENLKLGFTTSLMLAILDLERKVIVEIDVSDFVSTSIFLQNSADRSLFFPLAFVSKKHSTLECNYKIYNKEFFAIIQYCKELKIKLKESTFLLKKITNHKSLEYFMSTKQISQKQTHESEFFSRFNF